MKYINTGVRILSLIAGALAFGIVTLILFFVGVSTPWAWGMVVGAPIALLAAIILALVSRREHLKFLEAYRRVSGHVLEFSLATVCNLGKARRAYLFLTADSMRLFLWDRRPYLESTVRRDEVVIHHRTASPNRLTVVFDDDDRLELVVPYAEELLDSLRKSGYRVEEVQDHV